MWSRPGAIEFEVMARVLRTEFEIKSQQTVTMFAHSIGRQGIHAFAHII